MTKAGAAGALAFLAGCFGGDDVGSEGTGSGGDSPTAPDDDEMYDIYFTESTHNTMSDMSWNPRNTTMSIHPVQNFTYSALWQHNFIDNELSSELAKEWEIDGNVVEVELFESYWHNGDQFTTEDVAISYDIMFMDLENADSRDDHPIEEIEVVDDTTFRIHFRGDHPPAYEHWIDRPYRANSLVIDNRNVVADWYDELKSVDPETDEWAELYDEFCTTEEIYSPEEMDGAPVGNGPFKYEDHSDTWVEHQLWDEYAHADTINFLGARTEFHDDRALAFFEEETDIERNEVPPSPEDMDLMPDRYQLYRTTNQREFAPNFNHGIGLPGDPRPTYDRSIRESIHYVMNVQELSGIMGEEWEPLNEPEIAIPENVFENSPEEFQELFRELPLERREYDPEMAIEKVNESENYSYDESEGIVVCDSGDALVDAGEQARLEIIAREDIRLDLGQVYQQWLEDFGWEVDLYPVDSATEYERRTDGSFDLKMNSTSTEIIGEHVEGPELEKYNDRIHHADGTVLAVPEVGDWDGEIVGWDYAEAWDKHTSLPPDASTEEFAEYYVEAVWARNWLCSYMYSLVRSEPGALNNAYFEMDENMNINQITRAPDHGIRSPYQTLWATGDR